MKPGKYDFKSLKNVFSSISVYDSVELFSTDEDYRNYKTFDSILFDKKNKKIRGVVLEEGMIVTVPENTRYKTSKESEFVGSIIVGQNMQLKSGKYDFQAENKDVGVTIYNTVDDYKSSTNSGEYFYLKKGDKNKGIVVEEGQVISCSNIIKIKENNSNYYSGEVLVGDDKKVTPGFYDISSNSKKSKTIYVYENAESEKESKIFYKVTIPTNEKRRICLKEGNVLSLGDNIKLEKSESSINYLTGVIKIGEDIPSGAYNLYSIYKNTSISLYKNQSDFDAENVIENKSIQKKNPLFSYELRDGNYLKIDGCLKYVRVGDVSEEVKDESENTNEQSDSSQEMQQQIQTKTKEQIASELNKKLNAEVATVALEQYGRERYAKFKLHSAFGVIAEEPKDENTWLLKYNVTIVDNYGNKADTVVEAYVTGTSAKPEVTYFYVYP